VNHHALGLACAALLAAPSIDPHVVVEVSLAPHGGQRHYELTESQLTYSDPSGRLTAGKPVHLSRAGGQALADAIAQLQSSALEERYAAPGVVLDGFALEVAFVTAQGRRQLHVSNCSLPQLMPLITLINRRVPGAFTIPVAPPEVACVAE
jgi:hypothetical protein